MSEKKGKLVTCDRCGESIFLEHLGTDDFDGGYSKVDKYEEKPEGWHYVSGFGTLCPTCSSEAEDLVQSFMKGLNAQ